MGLSLGSLLAPPAIYLPILPCRDSVGIRHVVRQALLLLGVGGVHDDDASGRDLGLVVMPVLHVGPFGDDRAGELLGNHVFHLGHAGVGFRGLEQDALDDIVVDRFAVVMEGAHDLAVHDVGGGDVDGVAAQGVRRSIAGQDGGGQEAHQEQRGQE